MINADKVRISAPERIVIASRESALAMWQARHIQSRLIQLYPRADVVILGMTTEGDRRLGVSLAQIGGKGLFVKELEDALLGGRADLAVHSLKDVPMDLKYLIDERRSLKYQAIIYAYVGLYTWA